MPSLFWPLLTWQELAPTLIRLTLAAVFLGWAYRGLKTREATPRLKALSIMEAICGLLLIIGLWTQAAALLLAIDLIVRLIGKLRKGALFSDGVNYYFILLVLALCLLVLGGGLFAYDIAL